MTELSMWNRDIDPEIKLRARQEYAAALRRGVLVRPAVCASCGLLNGKRRLHGHHEDYGKPLEVKWLCSPCHHKAHRFTNHPEFEKRRRRLERVLRCRFMTAVGESLGCSASLIREYKRGSVLVPEGFVEKVKVLPRWKFAKHPKRRRAKP